MIFFFYFLRNFFARVEYERNLGQKFFSLFLGLSPPILAKNNAGEGFFNFLIFFYNFSEFSFPSRVWTEFGSKIFFSFSAYLTQFWLEIMPERVFSISWIFSYFFRNFLPRVEYKQNSGLKFFSLFLHLSHPILARNNAGKSFFNFFDFFFLFFTEFYCPGRVWTEFWSKNFFSLSRPISSHVG